MTDIRLPAATPSSDPRPPRPLVGSAGSRPSTTRPPVEAADSGARDHLPPSRRRLVAVVLAGAVIGAALGGALAAVGTGYRATSLVDLSSALTATDADAGSIDVADRFVQSELLFLNSATFDDQVSRTTGGSDDTDITATQQGNTDVVGLSADASSAATAEAVSAAAVEAYTEYRRGIIAQNLPGLQAQLADAQAALVAGAGGSAAELTVLQDRVDRLAQQVDQVQATAASAGAGGTVVETAAAAGAVAVVSPVLGTVAGAALGGLGGLLLLAVPRLLSRRVQGPDDVRTAGLPVVLPEVPRWPGTAAPQWRETTSDGPVDTAARLLAGRLLTARGIGVVAVSGAQRGVGASFVATALAVSSSRRRPTVLVAADDVLDGHVLRSFGVTATGPGLVDLSVDASAQEVLAVLQPSGIPGLQLLGVGSAQGRWERVESALADGSALAEMVAAGHTVVVDCPGLDTSTALLELAVLKPSVALVVEVDRTTEDALRRAAEQLEAAGMGVPQVVLNAGPQRRRRR